MPQGSAQKNPDRLSFFSSSSLFLCFCGRQARLAVRSTSRLECVEGGGEGRGEQEGKARGEEEVRAGVEQLERTATEVGGEARRGERGL
jgi:hypothetical protein